MTAPVLPPGEVTDAAPVAARSPLQLALRRLLADRVAVASAAVIALTVLVAIAAPLATALTGHEPHRQYRETGLDSFGTPVGPGSEFWFGTDQLGRDLFVRLAYGARISLFVGAVATVCSIGIGTLVGLIAGFRRGKVDVVLNWLMDTTLCLPQLLFAISLVSLAGPSLGITLAVIVLFTWAPIARVVRGQVMSLREREFVEAATSLGATKSRIMAVDVLPNLLVPIVIYGTLLVPQAIVFEATLSFLGLGVLPPTATWGNMLAAASAGSLYTVAWWMVVFPSAALLALTLAFNLLGDSVRDALDPRHAFRTKRGRKARKDAAVLLDAPADSPARTLAGPQATNVQVDQVRERLGLDLPVLERYGQFVDGLLHGDLGYSYYNQEPVLDTIVSRLPVTASIAFGAIAVALVVGVLVGIAAARRPGSFRDRASTLFVLSGLSVPTFVLGLVLLYVFFYLLTTNGMAIFPAAGYVPITEDPAEWARHLVLPWITVAFVTAATYARLTRGQLLGVLEEDYIRTARSKGLSERRVVYRHGLRSAVTPIFTQFGLDLALLMGGLVVTEQIFGLNGIGRMAVDSVNRGDQPVIVGVMLVASFFVVLANVLVDLGYALLDSRVRIA